VRAAALDALFHDAQTIRYGVGANLCRFAEIAAFRAARSLAHGLARELSATVISTYGHGALLRGSRTDAAAAMRRI
jgi:hypothetical protein